MTRAVLFLATAMVAASLALAQQNPAGTSNSGLQSNSDNSAQHTVIISGCLSSSGAGVYALADAQGATYTLAGNTDTLQGHVGQEIEVTGQRTFTSNASSTTQVNGNTIHVTKTRLVADHCSSSAKPGSSGPGMGGSNATGQNTHLQNVAQNSSDLSNGQLPQTSTILPLLGLIGLGSLVAGFFARR